MSQEWPFVKPSSEKSAYRRPGIESLGNQSPDGTIREWTQLDFSSKREPRFHWGGAAYWLMPPPQQRVERRIQRTRQVLQQAFYVPEEGKFRSTIDKHRVLTYKHRVD